MNETTNDAASIFSPLWRRKWMILAVAFLVAAGTYEYYKHEKPVYGASTELYLGSASEGQAKSALSGRSATANAVGLIGSPIISQLVRKRLHAEHTAVRGTVKVVAGKASDFIDISTRAPSPRAAMKLANAYAQAYIAHERAQYTRSLEAQISSDRQQLLRLELPAPPSTAKGAKSTSASTLQLANLDDKISQLEASLSTFVGVEQVNPAKAAAIPLSPAPKKNAEFGFVLGLLLASVAAYVLSRIDRRVSSLAEIEQIFHTEILAALPTVKAPVVRSDGTRAPARPLLEPLRRLDTTLRLGHAIDGARQGGPRVILFISSDVGDGKSALIANLARVQSDAGERVAVIEADFRRPVQARLLDATAPRGLADVLAGGVDAGAAMQTLTPSVPLGVRAEPGAGVATVVQPLNTGSISVLLSGGEVANPPALLGGEGMRELVRSVADDFDRVLIDAPPPLEVSDVMPLLPIVDGIVIVARIGHTRQVSAERLAQLLGRTASAPVLGAVANCVPRKAIERYGFTWAPAARRGRSKLSIR